MAAEGLGDTTEHFLHHKVMSTQDGQTWSILRQGQEVRSRTDYIICTYLFLLQNVVARNPRHNTNRYMVLRCLCDVTLRYHKC